MKRVTLPFLLFISLTASALPINWSGRFGVDSTLINNYRMISSSENLSNTTDGSQEASLTDGAHKNASFQNYIFQLSPTMIVNDSAILRGTFTTGYPSGGIIGSNRSNTKNGTTMAKSLYNQNISGTGTSLTVQKLYMELSSNTATYLIGRHSFNWGLGAIYSDGEGRDQRFTSIRDGLTMNMKVGNFTLTPFWAKLNNDSYTSVEQGKEYGIGFDYFNPTIDTSFGLLYVKKTNSPFYKEDGELGTTDTKLIDLYFKRKFGSFTIAGELPLYSGTIGNFYGAGASVDAKYKAKAFLTKIDYEFNDKWSATFEAGDVSGASGAESTFEALYLNPNFKIANILFAYNKNAVADNTQSIYDSYVTNVTYLKASIKIKTEKWEWTPSFVMATAKETAQTGSNAYNHSSGKQFTAIKNQDSSYGMEIDSDLFYKWNDELQINFNAGYLMTGDYYAFTNDPTVTNEADSTFMIKVGASLEF